MWSANKCLAVILFSSLSCHLIQCLMAYAFISLCTDLLEVPDSNSS